jgi:hypothetical protein
MRGEFSFLVGTGIFTFMNAPKLYELFDKVGKEPIFPSEMKGFLEEIKRTEQILLTKIQEGKGAGDLSYVREYPIGKVPFAELLDPGEIYITTKAKAEDCKKTIIDDELAKYYFPMMEHDLNCTTVFERLGVFGAFANSRAERVERTYVEHSLAGLVKWLSLSIQKKSIDFFKLVPHLMFYDSKDSFFAAVVIHVFARDIGSIRRLVIEQIKRDDGLREYITSLSSSGIKIYQSVDEYIMRHAQDAATEIEIVALARALRRPIVLIASIDKLEYKENLPIFVGYCGNNCYVPLKFPCEPCGVLTQLRKALEQSQTSTTSNSLDPSNTSVAQIQPSSVSVIEYSESVSNFDLLWSEMQKSLNTKIDDKYKDNLVALYKACNFDVKNSKDREYFIGLLLKSGCWEKNEENTCLRFDWVTRFMHNWSGVMIQESQPYIFPSESAAFFTVIKDHNVAATVKGNKTQEIQKEQPELQAIAIEAATSPANFWHFRCKSHNVFTFFGKSRISKEEAEQALRRHHEQKHAGETIITGVEQTTENHPKMLC